jgi:hypothetical protein
MKRWLLAWLLLLAGCTSVAPEDYRDARPRLDLFGYFEGTVDAWGQVQDRSGKVIRRFTVLMQGRVEGDRLTLQEDFVYADGKKERRVWVIDRVAQNRYRGTAGDVIGEAVGVAAGNVLNWRYVLAVQVDGRTWHLSLDDWMYLQDERVMLNRAVMSKSGFTVGEVFLAFRRRG